MLTYAIKTYSESNGMVADAATMSNDSDSGRHQNIESYRAAPRSRLRLERTIMMLTNIPPVVASLSAGVSPELTNALP